MNGLRDLAENWFTYLNAIGVVGGLLFTGYSLHSEAETRKVANLLKLTQSHREVWKEVLNNPKLIRVLSPDVELVQVPVTREEEIFITLVTQHLVSVFRAMRKDLTISPEGLRRDVWQFFALPIPQQVWGSIKVMQDDDFVAFVEACQNWK